MVSGQVVENKVQVVLVTLGIDWDFRRSTNLSTLIKSVMSPGHP